MKYSIISTGSLAADGDTPPAAARSRSTRSSTGSLTSMASLSAGRDTGPAGVRSATPALLGNEGQVGDAAGALVLPARGHAHARRHLVGAARVDHVQERGVGAVEADQRERKGVVERVLAGRRGDPCPRLDHAARSDLGEAGRVERVTRRRVPLERRGEHTPVAGLDPEQSPVTQAREERPDDRAECPRVRELDLVGGEPLVRHDPGVEHIPFLTDKWAARPASGGPTASIWRSTISKTDLRSLPARSEEHTSELQSHHDIVCRLLLE